ncbi:TetR/AcrR family transcriptional regulator [Qipengyuania sphaerica]|uniref:TetR/AcrR family transcriptional regulator n=1 Tax=Qipengyuania sphaerica TaxID=2867243 RepID=UPI001C8731E7|nr:TetR/AcrR family transcriptional regulator [Qipengyuania sphaerica]MBX7539569.1 TetR/AcrR family transcriptional regulator [Qipengyuania sphaerica]
MKQARGQETREKVLETAAELIVAHGHANVSLRDICDQSGISNGSVFHHFGSKDGIIRELFLQERRRYLGAIAKAITGYDGDPCDAFAEGARAAAEFQLADVERFMHLIADFNDSEWLRENRDVWLNAALDIQQPVIDWAMPHFASGALPVMPPTLFQALSLGPAEFLMRSQRQGRIEDAAVHIDTIVAGISASLRHLRDVQAAQRAAADDAA